LGKPRSELRKQYKYVDFDSAFDEDDQDEKWHYVPSDDDVQNYVEWRPHGQGQVYACLGEPQQHFDQRMTDLVCWLENREETCIAVVCHAGVIQWMLGEIFENCELRVVPLDTLLQPTSLLLEEDVNDRVSA
jgi:broad specificity phosphatase PhoE